MNSWDDFTQDIDLSFFNDPKSMKCCVFFVTRSFRPSGGAQSVLDRYVGGIMDLGGRGAEIP